MLKPIFSLIVIILSVGFAFLYTIPQYNDFKERRDNLATLTEVFKDADKIKKLISETEETLNTIESDNLSRFEVFLPETSDPIRLANNLQKLGIANGITLEDIKVERGADKSQKDGSNAGGILQGVTNIFASGDSAQKESVDAAGAGEKNFVTTKANFTFVATSEAFHNFLYDTERSLGLINVTTLSFTPIQVATDSKKPKQEAPAIYQYTVAIETYSLK
ncbi:MAG: hypothetical protein AAB497_01730 [Patescibacteria group bacterium]